MLCWEWRAVMARLSSGINLLRVNGAPITHWEHITGVTVPLIIQSRLALPPISFQSSTRFLGFRAFPPPLNQSLAEFAKRLDYPLFPALPCSVASLVGEPQFLPCTQATASVSVSLYFSLFLSFSHTHTHASICNTYTHIRIHTHIHIHANMHTYTLIRTPLRRGVRLCSPHTWLKVSANRERQELLASIQTPFWEHWSLCIKSLRAPRQQGRCANDD